MALAGSTVLVGAASSAPAAADQVTSLKTQAKTISEELVQEQLEAGAYQQQYSVASAQVAKDQRAIASLQTQIETDRQQVAKRLHLVQHLAVESYVLNGSVSSGSGAALFAENVSTVQSADEYATISIGNLNEAVEGLHVAKRNEQSQQQSLVRRRTLDQSAQSPAGVVPRAGQRLGASHADRAGTGHRAAGRRRGPAECRAGASRRRRRDDGAQSDRAAQPGSHASLVSLPLRLRARSPHRPSTTDPTLPPFLACVVQAESGGNYQAVSPNGLYMGAFQFSQSTWNFAAQAAHRPDLVGVPPESGQQGRPGHPRRHPVRPRRRAALAGRSLQRLTALSRSGLRAGPPPRRRAR